MENNINNTIFNPKDKLREQSPPPPEPIQKLEKLPLSQTKEKIYIIPPYESKDDVKAEGGIWDCELKMWYIKDKENKLYELYKKQCLVNDYSLKDYYKNNKGKWDHHLKHWYTYNSNEKLQEHFLNKNI